MLKMIFNILFNYKNMDEKREYLSYCLNIDIEKLKILWNIEVNYGYYTLAKQIDKLDNLKEIDFQ